MSGLFSQIAMIAISAGIIFTYVQPAFTKIGEKQDQIAIYKEELDKVSSVNHQLASLISQIDQISTSDQTSLLAYMPNDVDEISIPRDLRFMAIESGVILRQAVFSSIDPNQPTGKERFSPPVPYIFNFSVEGTYGQIKDLLRLMEQNNYPLEIRTLEIKPVDEGKQFLSADMTLATYGHTDLDSINN